jgi:hypothetical protein
MSQSPAGARHIVPVASLASVGHASAAPSQLSATSQAPADVRHSVPAAAFASAGQVSADPSQLSATSQFPADARHIVPIDNGAQIPFIAAPVATLHAWQSVGLPPPQAALQQTPSVQNPLAQSVLCAHVAPLALHPTGFAPVHVPVWHVSVCVHATPSLQVEPSTLLGLVQVPVAVLQVPMSWH